VVHYGTVDSPEVGVAYEYHLYIHCGVRAALFGGRWWLAIQPGPLNPPPVAGPTAIVTGYLTGSMTLLAADHARFDWDSGTAEFTPAQSEPVPCT
jgi:hypothetical protein